MSENNDNNTNKKLLKSGLSLSLLTFMSRIMGLIREMTKAAFLGTSMFADAFTTSFMIPNLLRRLFAENAISVAFIPTFKKYISGGDDDEHRKSTQEFLNATFTLVSFCTTVVVVIGILITPFIAPIFTDNSTADYLLKQQEITILTRIMFPYLIVISIAALFQGILNTCGIFSPSGFTPVLFNGIVILGTYVLSPRTANPARAMAIGVIAGGCVQAIFQLPFVLKTGWKISFTSLKKTFSNPGTKKVIALIGPTVIGMAAYQLNDLVCTSIANKAAVGIASSLQYSLRLQELILGIFVVSISTVILPDLSGFANNKDWENFNSMLIQAVKIVTLISIPVTAYSLVSGKELISVLYKTKSFDDESVLLTLGEFRWHIAGLLFIGLNRIIAPAFYAQQNTKLPTLAGIISFISNIIFAIALVIPMSGNGIALALSLASAVNTVFLFVFMKKMESFNVGKLIKDELIYILKISLFSLIAVVPTYFVRAWAVDFFDGHGRLISYGAPVLITAIVFAAVGVGLLVITKDEMTKFVLRKAKRT